MSGKLVVVRDNSEPFTQSKCGCPFCISTHIAVAEWDNYVPETKLQHRMMDAVSRIEDMIAKQNKKRRSPRLGPIDSN